MRFLLTSWLMACAVGALCPARGAAFCRTTTMDSMSSGCPSPCETQGLPFYWPTRQVSYVLSERGFPDLDDEQVRDILDRSFGSWLEVECDGRPIDFEIAQEAGFTSLGPRPKEEEPRSNVLAHLSEEEWEDDRHAFAITNLRYDRTTGHIVGADMFFNGGMDPFGVCPANGCPANELTDLSNVVTHEAGHFLGLAHSQDQYSTMWCDAAPGDVDKRTLGADDIEGICSIYGPSAVHSPPPSHVKPGGGLVCSVGARPSGRLGAGYLVFSLLGALGYRRRR